MLDQLVRFQRRFILQGPKNRFEKILYLGLVPLSLVYGCVSWIRCYCYTSGILPRFRAKVPVISVGNLAAGGTGKTPLVDLLLKVYLESGGKPAVISRGYSGSFTGKAAIVSRGEGVLMTAAEAGTSLSCWRSEIPQLWL